MFGGVKAGHKDELAEFAVGEKEHDPYKRHAKKQTRKRNRRRKSCK